MYSKPFIDAAFKNGGFERIYESVKNDETESKDILIEFEKNYPHTANAANADDILKALKNSHHR